LLPYSALKAANVNGTKQILHLCFNIRMKELHYISTLAVFAKSKVTVSENTLLFSSLDDINNFSGYSQSKWVAENLVQNARTKGLPVAIYRLPNVLGDSINGCCNESDMLQRILCGMCQMNLAPDIDWYYNYAIADFVSEAIINISLKSELVGKNYHVCNDEAIELSILLRYAQSFGYKINFVSYSEWYKALQTVPSVNMLYTLKSAFLPRDISGFSEIFGTKNLKTTLDKLSPINISEEIVHKYLKFFISRKLIDPP